MSFTLPTLKYDYKALEPYIDAQTMEIHHSKHHAAYTNNLNAAIENTELAGKAIEELFTNVSKLAKLANLSPSRFHTVFKKITGTGPMEYHKKLRLNAAFRLLLTTDEKLKSISEKTGFCNEFHLSRDFKGNYGKSPREYRKMELRNLV